MQKAFWRRNRDGKCAEQRKPDHQRRDLETAADFLFSDCAGHLFSADLQHGRCGCRGKICRYRSIGGGGRLHQPDHQPDCRFFCRTFFRCNGGHLPVLRRKGEAGIAKCTAYRVCLFGGGQRGHFCDWDLSVSNDASLDEYHRGGHRTVHHLSAHLFFRNHLCLHL